MEGERGTRMAVGGGAGTPRFRERVVVATSNRGKLEELRALLADLPIDALGVSEVLREPPQVVEDGATFADNAVKKARAVADATLMLSLADDSGLEVDALDGRPGVKSARFAHARATDAENNAALLAALEARGDPTLPSSAASAGSPARFRCALALIDPLSGAAGAEVHVVEGVCEGLVTRTPRGSGGFGYDPLFIVSGKGRTMAELEAEEKNRVSHRARALAALRPILERIVAERRALAARVLGDRDR